jgi:hypothetical protein
MPPAPRVPLIVEGVPFACSGRNSMFSTIVCIRLFPKQKSDLKNLEFIVWNGDVFSCRLTGSGFDPSPLMADFVAKVG